VKDENGVLLADSHNILNRWKNYFSQLLNVHNVSDVRVGLKINVEKTKHMLLSRHQNVDQNWDIKIANRSFENVSKFKYLGTTVTNQNLIEEKIKRRLNSGNTCCNSVQNLLSSSLLPKNVKIRI
jgi:hypothetical protein